MEEAYHGTWHTAFGERVFQFDAFLSHNNNDGSERLHDELIEKGSRVWYDGNADMNDRRVKDRVELAINASRYILVCVPKSFRDSEWVRAEYMPSLIQSRLDGVGPSAANNAELTRALKACRLPLTYAENPRGMGGGHDAG